MRHILGSTVALALAATTAACIGAPPEIAAGGAASLAVRDTAVNVTTASEHPAEDSARAQVHRLLQRYDLRPWLFTRTIRIQRGVIPHSHPVLTLNTRYLGDDAAQLGALVHEQLHWFVESKPTAEAAAIRALRARYVQVPVGGADGARSEESTYLHLIVCFLEYDGLSQLLGDPLARQQLQASRHYRWIYARVLEDTEALRALVIDAGFQLPGRDLNEASRERTRHRTRRGDSARGSLISTRRRARSVHYARPRGGTFQFVARDRR